MEKKIFVFLVIVLLGRPVLSWAGPGEGKENDGFAAKRPYLR